LPKLVGPFADKLLNAAHFRLPAKSGAHYAASSQQRLARQVPQLISFRQINRCGLSSILS
jgi:hypothetical protein